jgi:hypothetical protein
MRLEGLGQMLNPMTPWGIEAATLLNTNVNFRIHISSNNKTSNKNASCLEMMKAILI